MENGKLSWGLLSTARINRALIPAIRAASRSVLSAVASRSPDSAAAYAKENRIPRSFGSYEAMLADPQIDVVYISLPNHLHKEWAIKAVEAGKHVLVEKPAALTVEDVHAMESAARAHQRVIAEAFMYRHTPNTRKVQELVASGAIGEVRAIQGVFTFLLDNPANIRMQPQMGGGALWDIGCYPLTYSRLVAGRVPQTVTGWQTNTPSGVDLTFTGQLIYPNGIVSQMMCSFGVPEHTTMEIFGSKGTLYIPLPFKPTDPSVPITLYTAKEHKEFLFPPRNLYLGEVEDMEKAILDGSAPLISLAETAQNVATILALYRSAALHQSVSLP